MSELTRLPFELAQADNFTLFDDFLRVSPERQTIQYIQPALSGASLTQKAIFVADRAIRITDAQIFPDGTNNIASGADYISVWLLDNGTSSQIASATYNSSSGSGAFPATHTLTSLGALTNQDVAAGTGVFLTVTNGSSADTPATIVEIGYTDLAAIENWAVYLPNGGNAVVSDGLAGILTITPSGATAAAGDSGYLYSPQQVFTPTSGQPINFEAMIQYAEVNTNQAGIFVGIASSVLASEIIVGSAASIRTTGTIIGFYKLAGQTAWSVIVQINGGTPITCATDIPAGLSTYTKLSFEVLDTLSGQATVVFRVDDELVRNSSTPQVPFTALATITSANLGSVVVGVSNGGTVTSGEETINVDYLGCNQVRAYSVGADG